MPHQPNSHQHLNTRPETRSGSGARGTTTEVLFVIMMWVALFYYDGLYQILELDFGIHGHGSAVATFIFLVVVYRDAK